MKPRWHRLAVHLFPPPRVLDLADTRHHLVPEETALPFHDARHDEEGRGNAVLLENRQGHVEVVPIAVVERHADRAWREIARPEPLHRFEERQHGVVLPQMGHLLLEEIARHHHGLERIEEAFLQCQHAVVGENGERAALRRAADPGQARVA